MAAIVYHKPVLLAHGFYKSLLLLLDQIPSLDDPHGLDDLYSWSLVKYDELIGDKYASGDMLDLQQLVTAMCRYVCTQIVVCDCDLQYATVKATAQC